MELHITVHGSPAPQGSKSAKGIGPSGHAVLVESSKAVKPWREAVIYAAIEARAGRNAPLFRGPVALNIKFYLRRPQRPKHHRPDRTPDLSKLVRSTEDALTLAGIWEDDARVVTLGVEKYYAEPHRVMDVPGAIIFITDAV